MFLCLSVIWTTLHLSNTMSQWFILGQRRRSYPLIFHSLLSLGSLYSVSFTGILPGLLLVWSPSDSLTCLPSLGRRLYISEPPSAWKLLVCVRNTLPFWVRVTGIFSSSGSRVSFFVYNGLSVCYDSQVKEIETSIQWVSHIVVGGRSPTSVLHQIKATLTSPFNFSFYRRWTS